MIPRIDASLNGVQFPPISMGGWLAEAYGASALRTASLETTRYSGRTRGGGTAEGTHHWVRNPSLHTQL